MPHNFWPDATALLHRSAHIHTTKATPVATEICIGTCLLATYNAQAQRPFSAQAGASVTATASCLPGFLAVGGGYNLIPSATGIPGPFSTLADEPVLSGNKSPTGWQATLSFTTAGQGTLAVDTICQIFSTNILNLFKPGQPGLGQLSIQTCKGTCQLNTTETTGTPINVLAGNTAVQATASCGTGSTEISGGYFISPSSNLSSPVGIQFSTLQTGPIFVSLSQPGQWQVKLQSTQAVSGETLIATSLCQQLTTATASNSTASCTTICKLVTNSPSIFINVANYQQPAVAVAIDACNLTGISNLSPTGTTTGGGFNLTVQNPPAFTLFVDTPFVGNALPLPSLASATPDVSGLFVVTGSSNSASSNLSINSSTSCQQLMSGL